MADKIPNPLPQLVIEILPSGVVNVSGPIGDAILCYGLLESAKDAIRSYNERARNRPAVETAPAGALLDMAERAKAIRELRAGENGQNLSE